MMHRMYGRVSRPSAGAKARSHHNSQVAFNASTLAQTQISTASMPQRISVERDGKRSGEQDASVDTRMPSSTDGKASSLYKFLRSVLP